MKYLPLLILMSCVSSYNSTVSIPYKSNQMLLLHTYDDSFDKLTTILYRSGYSINTIDKEYKSLRTETKNIGQQTMIIISAYTNTDSNLVISSEWLPTVYASGIQATYQQSIYTYGRPKLAYYTTYELVKGLGRIKHIIK